MKLVNEKTDSHFVLKSGRSGFLNEKRMCKLIMNETKYLEYYMDSRIYTSEQVQESIEETKKEFPNKKIKVTLALNDFGVYIITFKFENKNNYFNKLIIKLKSKFKRQMLLNEYKEYGQYKTTKIYRPY